MGFEAFKSLLVFRRPQPVYAFAREGIEWFGDRGKTPDKGAIKIAKAQERANVLNLVWHGPVSDRCNFDRVHTCHPLFKDYPQVIDTRGMENTLFWFEVQVVICCKLQNIGNRGGVISVAGSCGDSYIIHVNADRGSEKFVLSYYRTENVVHHGLESSGGIGESKEHDRGLVQPVSCFEGCLVFITFFDTHIVISPPNIQLCVYVRASQVSDKVGYEGEWVLVADCDIVDAPVVLYGA